MSLTKEQQDIVNLDLDAKVLVTAGPGTGKTHTLIARLAHLIQNNDVAPGQEILVLSFSRAAVREIRNRCADVGDDLAYVNVTTFDSYATRLLSMIEPDGEWASQGYDGRIENAVRVIQLGLAEDYLCDIKHVFVDEIQDLVGIRAELVKTILENINAGFGLFGDPAQGIYNFQLEDPNEREIGSAALYEWVRENFGSDLTERKLSKNHRATSKAAQTALWAGEKLNQNSPSFKSIYDCLTSDLQGLQLLGNQDDFAEKLKKAKGNTAVLCRNNGQALMLSRKLHEAEVEHILGRGADDRLIPAWIARVLSQSTFAILSKNTFAAYCMNEGIDETGIEEKWRLLKKTEGENAKSLNLFRLNSNCRQSNIPDWMNEYKLSQIAISSIHRAKGLEFDTVIVATCDRFEDEEEFVGEECRTLYVALTRPKRNLCRLKIPSFKGLTLNDKYKRWCRKWDWRTPDIEVKFSDFDRAEPPESITARGQSPAEIQAYIAENINRGDSVELKRVGSNGNRYDAVYHILHNDFVVGRTVPNFAGELLNIIRQKYRKGELPSNIGPLPVEGVETVFGDPSIADAKGLKSPAGVWLNVRVGGLGYLKYGEND
jgi:hypothetical protein